MTAELPLVSIIVITYNSSEFVLETLESAKAQSYKNIELIISDDGSTDETLQICNNWLEQNKEYFVRTKLVTIDKNTGIPANCNRGLYASSGKWMKLIAADDALLEDCIMDNISYVILHPDVQVLQSDCNYYDHFLTDTNFIRRTHQNKTAFFNENISARDQYNLLLIKNRILAPSIFIKTQTLLNINGFDERLKLIEDYPMWLKLTEMGIKIFSIDKVTCKYRISSHSVTKSKQPFMSKEYAKQSLLFYKLYKEDKIDRFKFLKAKLSFSIIILLNLLSLNRRSFISSLLFKSATKLKDL